MGQRTSNFGDKISALIPGERRRMIVALAVLTVLGLIAVNSFYNSSEPADSSSFNRADIMFMNMMIIHHDQAIEMAELAENRTDNENILELSGNISKAQRSENEQMAEWLRQLGYQRPVRGHRMAGMASNEEMERLENSTGSEFDLLFSKLMIEHHRGGIQMAQNFIQSGRNPELIELEREMVEAQTQEIQLMQKWRENWG